MAEQGALWLVVTGASSGIGACVAQGLQQQGFRVIATARKSDDLQRLQQQGLSALELDLGNATSVTRAAETIKALTGGNLYGLFNNAAFGLPGALEDISREQLAQQFQVNLLGTHQLTRELLPLLRAEGGGRIVFNSSVLGLVAFPWQGAYNATKFALEGLADTWRLELRDTPVQVSLVEPGPIQSRFRHNALNAFQNSVSWQHSRHAEHYRQVQDYYAAHDHPAPFTAGPEAVLRRVRHAFSASRPRVRYYVTLPTYFLVAAKRLLPAWGLDALVARLARRR